MMKYVYSRKEIVSIGFGIFFGIVLLAGLLMRDDNRKDNNSSSNKTIQTNNTYIADTEAKVICMNAFKESSKYGGSDPSMLGTVSMKMNDSEHGEIWFVTVPGTMKNAYNADVKTNCRCKIPLKRRSKETYSLSNITYFKCE